VAALKAADIKLTECCSEFSKATDRLAEEATLLKIECQQSREDSLNEASVCQEELSGIRDDCVTLAKEHRNAAPADEYSTTPLPPSTPPPQNAGRRRREEAQGGVATTGGRKAYDQSPSSASVTSVKSGVFAGCCSEPAAGWASYLNTGGGPARTERPASWGKPWSQPDAKVAKAVEDARRRLARKYGDISPRKGQQDLE